ncbi:hypothetical protein GCM10022217_01270 [Chryseobacterium ginsenosidimutans]|uniref:hypothetical protein n=1 Tax=Chryseobacterium ginsenosidimutans TaxID=687846 RepID=UPI0031D2B114
MRLRLCYSSTPARIYGLDTYDNFEHYGFLKLKINYEGEIKEFSIGYTKPFQNKELNIFANLINLNQNGDSGDKLKFNEWQKSITGNKTVVIDIFDFKFTILD